MIIVHADTEAKAQELNDYVNSGKDVFMLIYMIGWVKEAEDRAVLKNAIKRVAFKNIKQINEWIKENPGCTDPRTKKHDKYNMIVMNSMSGTTIQEQQDNIEKIVKNVTKAVTIDKSYIKALKH